MMSMVLGSESMIGKELCSLLPNCVQISHKYYDLIDFESCRDAFDNIEWCNYKEVYMLAGFNGNLNFCTENAAEIYYQTTQMNLNVLRCCQIYKVDKVVSVIASCSYPDLGTRILEEKDINNGDCNISVEAHGYAKRTILHYSRQLYRQYGIKTVNAILTNCYGPGDRFDVSRTKVVGAVIKKLCDAKLNGQQEVTFFGTGSPKREIMFARDAAKALFQLGESYDDYMKPINVGSDQEIDILNLVLMVSDLVDYRGGINWDTSKPDGQMRKKLSTNKMKDYVSLDCTPLVEGLKETIQYYMDKGRFLER